jgi:chromosomal replication initiation ATPase DnaA
LGQFATSAGADRTTGGLLYVHGQKGVGKTHLLDTVVNEWVSDGLQVQAYSGVGLLAELSSAGVPRGQSLQAYWKSQMKQARYLAIDDVDVLLRPGIDWAQADLRMILEALEEAKGRCIITAGHAPDDRSGQLDEGLATILRKAEVLELRPADLSMRRAIAWDCLLHSHVRVTRDVVDFIANSVADVPKLLAVCHNVSVAADKEGGIGIKNVQSVLRKQGISVRKEDMPDVARKTVAAAIEAMGERISLESIAGQRLRQDVIPLRNQIIVRLVEERSLKQKMVAEAFGISTQAVSLIVKQTRTKM